LIVKFEHRKSNVNVQTNEKEEKEKEVTHFFPFRITVTDKVCFLSDKLKLSLPRQTLCALDW